MPPSPSDATSEWSQGTHGAILAMVHKYHAGAILRLRFVLSVIIPRRDARVVFPATGDIRGIFLIGGKVKSLLGWWQHRPVILGPRMVAPSVPHSWHVSQLCHSDTLQLWLSWASGPDVARLAAPIASGAMAATHWCCARPWCNRRPSRVNSCPGTRWWSMHRHIFRRRGCDGPQQGG